MNAAKFAMYALSLADVSFDAIAFDSEGMTWSLLDREGEFAGLATWEQVQASLAAGNEGWIKVHGRICYVEGNVDEMTEALKAFWAIAS